jgi:hypothetical protein
MNQTYVELPAQRFIGGNGDVYVYEIVDGNGRPVDLSGAAVKFTLANFSTKTVVISKTCEILREPGDAVPYPYKARVALDAADTVGLHGEFIQQLQLTDFYGKRKQPAEGRIIVIRNSEPHTASRFWYDDAQDGAFFATPDRQTLPVGSSYNIRAFYISKTTQKLAVPAYSQLTFASSDPSVARVSNTVSNSGSVAAVGAGQCEIYVAATARPSIYAKVFITVEQPNVKWHEDVAPGTFRAVPDAIGLLAGGVFRARIFYTSAAIETDLSPSYTELLFETGDETVATVDAHGLIFAVNPGTCRINVKLAAMNGVETNITVNVTAELQ